MESLAVTELKLIVQEVVVSVLIMPTSGPVVMSVAVHQYPLGAVMPVVRVAVDAPVVPVHLKAPVLAPPS